MITRLTKTLLGVALLAAYGSMRPAVCEAWSLLHPFSSDADTAKQPVPQLVKKEPSALEKVGTGTKNFFNKTGETLGLKKPEPKKPQYANPIPPRIQPKAKDEQKSWLGQMFGPEEREKLKSVSDWMQNPRLDP